ncbi:hypothetical protein HZS_6322, partial [Henneguya salminicola]
LENKIRKLEKQNIGEKPWNLLGEVDSKSRPKDSLLEKYLSFDYGCVKAPEITEKVSQQIEGIIKQRIKDKTWDDVDRKQKPISEDKFRISRSRISSEKSKEGLAEIYEKSYIDNLNKIDKSSKERPEIIEIKKELDVVIEILDSLTNHYFAPKPSVSEIKIKNIAPAMNLEDILPVHATECLTFAPEEIAAPINDLPAGPNEITDTQRKNFRRKKKIFQQNKYKKIEEKNNSSQPKIKKTKSKFGSQRYFQNFLDDIDLNKKKTN